MVRDKHEDMFSAMFDRDATSTIDINEFKTLWQFIVQWEKIFRGYDEDGSGKIDKDEFRKALTSFGNDERKREFPAIRISGYLHIDRHVVWERNYRGDLFFFCSNRHVRS